MDEIYRLEKVETEPVDFPIEGVEVDRPLKPEIIERVELEASLAKLIRSR